YKIIHRKELMGDKSKTHQVVKEIDEKTDLNLLKEYRTNDELYNHIDEHPKAIQKKISQDIDMLHLSRQLAEIKCDVPIPCAIDDALWKLDEKRVQGVFQKLEFKNMDKWLPAN